ncbi:MAG: hypothetical protein M3548_03810 [Actinomycetota bacterium]|nr:hypothetical protein [Actinomycetota bacterium]
MTIDPMHLPIFGDPRPAEPPVPVRAASGLLIVQALLSGAHLVYVSTTTGQDLSLFVVPLALLVWFALSVRAGRDWARLAAGLVGALSLLLTVVVLSSLLDVVMLSMSTVLIAHAVHLMYRGDVGDYFMPVDADRTESV